MKKFKLLPLMGAALLALVGCSSSGGEEISRKQALGLYKAEKAAEYSLAVYEHYNSIDAGVAGDIENAYYPQVVNGKLKEGTTIPDVSAALTTLDMYGYLSYFHENQGLDSNDTFFNNADVKTHSLARYFEEDSATYMLEDHRVGSHFTGATTVTISDQKYGLAMYFIATYNKVGLLKKATFELAVATDLNAQNSAETVLKYKGLLLCSEYLKASV